MESLSSSAKYLREKGLIVTERSGRELAISRPGDVELSLRASASGYELSCWEWVPGPGLDDFLMIFASLDEALLAVWNFYFGRPIKIDSAIVDLHRRPYWSLAKLQYRLANLVTVSHDQFAEIARRRSERIEALQSQIADRYQLAEQSQFLWAASQREGVARMALRRDLEEGYVVMEVISEQRSVPELSHD